MIKKKILSREEAKLWSTLEKWDRIKEKKKTLRQNLEMEGAPSTPGHKLFLQCFSGSKGFSNECKSAEPCSYISPESISVLGLTAEQAGQGLQLTWGFSLTNAHYFCIAFECVRHLFANILMDYDKKGGHLSILIFSKRSI